MGSDSADDGPAQNTAYQTLAEAPAESAGIPSATAFPMVEVVAPSTLSEGYTFEATAADGKPITVVVPSGGVEGGQTFMVPLEGSTEGPSGGPAFDIPSGRWKDGLCECLGLGCCHPLICLACWCQPIALAQVMTRMRLTWCGQEGHVGERTNTFRNVTFAFFAFIVLDSFLKSLYRSYLPQNAESYALQDLPVVSMVSYIVDSILGTAFSLYMLYLLVVTRKFIRTKYSIPERRCHGCEDCCCSFWCGCCTLTQMARHTADYDTYVAACCTETGLPSHVSAIVV